MPALKATALVADGVTIERGSRVLLSALSLRVAAGRCLVLKGANGAGKTTLLRALAGFVAPTAGSIRLEGQADGEIGEACHFVGHLNAVKARLTVAENAGFWARYLAAREAPAIEPALARLGLDRLADVPAGYLSAGQQRRLGLARLLVARRPVWLLDEPTVSLDAAGAGTLAGIVDEHTVTGGIVVAATHLPLGFARTSELRLGPESGRACP